MEKLPIEIMDALYKAVLLDYPKERVFRYDIGVAVYYDEITVTDRGDRSSKVGRTFVLKELYVLYRPLSVSGSTFVMDFYMYRTHLTSSEFEGGIVHSQQSRSAGNFIVPPIRYVCFGTGWLQTHKLDVFDISEGLDCIDSISEYIRNVETFIQLEGRNPHVRYVTHINNSERGKAHFPDKQLMPLIADMMSLNMFTFNIDAFNSNIEVKYDTCEILGYIDRNIQGDIVELKSKDLGYIDIHGDFVRLDTLEVKVVQSCYMKIDIERIVQLIEERILKVIKYAQYRKVFNIR